jgi:hypothetical protein
VRAAYADPPYIGQAAKLYSERPDYGGEVDHQELVRYLSTFDAWALSAHSGSIATIVKLPGWPSNVRIAAWVKPFSFYKKGVNPAYGWEPVFFSGARSDAERRKVMGVKHAKTVKDWLSANAWGVTARERAESDVKGRKREEFSFWLFELLGLVPWDEFYDLFPGSGAVTTAWGKWCDAWEPPLP